MKKEWLKRRRWGRWGVMFGRYEFLTHDPYIHRKPGWFGARIGNLVAVLTW